MKRPPTVLTLVKQMKHRAYVLRKRGRFAAKRAKFDLATKVFRHASLVRPYRYRPARYANTFLHVDAPSSSPSKLPRRVFAIWAGENELTPNRARNLDLIRKRLGVPVELVTPANLDQWIADGHPLHSSYPHLSLIHRSDYLRGYLMHHHGGGYVDIKEPAGSWVESFEQMAADEQAWVTSYVTTHANWIGKLRGRIGLDILVRYRLMFGKCAFIMRSHTPLTSEWMAQMDAVLTESEGALERYPGGTFGELDHYPLSWTDLLGRVLDPLSLKHHSHIRYDDRMLLNFENYR